MNLFHILFIVLYIAPLAIAISIPIISLFSKRVAKEFVVVSWFEFIIAVLGSMTPVLNIIAALDALKRIGVFDNIKIKLPKPKAWRD